LLQEEKGYQQLWISLCRTMTSLVKPGTSTMPNPNLWQSLIPSLKERVSEQNFEIWLSSARFAFADERRLVLEVPNTFFQEYLSEHYLDVIQEELYRKTKREYQIAFEVARGEEPAKPAGQEEPKAPELEGATEPGALSINPKYRFDTFVVGPSYQFAYAPSAARPDP